MSGLDDVLDGVPDDDEEFDLDFSGVEDFSPLNGTFLCRCTGVERNPLDKNGNKSLKTEWTVIEGEFTDRKVWDRWTLGGNGLAYLQRKLRAIGIDTERGKLSMGAILGKEGILVVGPQKNNPEYSEVKSIRAAKRGTQLG